MKHTLYIFSFIFLILISFNSYSQVPNWLFKIGSTNDDASYKVKIAPNNNIILAGHFRGTIDLDPSSSTYNITAYSNTQDMFVACYSPTGAFIWGFPLGKEDYDEINAIAIDANNNVYVGGFFRGTNVDFDPSPSTTYYMTCLGFIGGSNSIYGGDGFVAKYSSSGTFQWALQLGTPYWTEAVDALATDINGNLIVGGIFKDTLDFDPSSGSTVLNANVSGTAYLAKYTTNKQLLWAFNFGKSGIAATDNTVRGIATDNSGNIYIDGFVQYATNIDFDPSPSSSVVLVPSGSYDGFVAKYSPSGAYMFAFLLGGSGTEDLWDIALDNSNNIYITGYTTGTSFDFDPSPSTATISTAGSGKNIILGKYTSSGAYQWGKLIGGSGDDHGRGLVVSKNKLYLTGHFSTTTNFNPSASPTSNLTSAGLYDIFLAKYQLSGTYECGFRIGSTLNDEGMYIAADTAGYIYSAGYFSGSNVDFDPGINTLSTSSSGATDGYLIKYSWDAGGGSGYLIGDTVCPGEQAYLTYIDTTGATTVSISYMVGSNTYARTVQSGVPFSISPNPTTTTSYTLIVSNTGCNYTIGNTVSAVINPLPTANAGNDTGVCPVNTIQLHATGGGTYNWYSSSGITNAGTQNPLVSGLTAGTYYVVVTNSFNCKDTDDINVAINPTPNANAGNDTSICPVSTLQLHASGGNTYYWYSSSSITNPSSQNPTISGASAGTYYVIATNSFNCKDTDDVNVSLYPVPTAYAGNDTSICPTNSIQLYATGGSTYYWYSSFSITNPTSQNPTVSGATSATYYVIATNTYSCKDTDDVNVSLYPVPTANAGNDTGVCPVNTIQLYGTGGGTYNWYSSSAITNPGTQNPLVSGLTAGTYYVVVTNSFNCKDTDDINVTINPVPVAFAGNDTNICPVSTMQLHASGGSSYFWYSSSSITNPSSQNPTISGITPGTYNVIATNSFSCKDTDDIIITINPVPIANAGNDTSICPTNPIQLHATGGNTYNWYSSSAITNPTSQNPTVSGTVSATYYVIATNAYNCKDTDDVIVFINPVPVANAGNDTGVCPVNIIQLHATGGGTYNWYSSSGITNAGTQNPLVSGLTAGTYYVVVTNSFNCKDTDDINVTINPVPIAFAGNDTTVCATNSISLHATGGSNYYWYSTLPITNPTSQYPSISAIVSGTYYVIATNTYGCNDTDDITVNVQPAPLSDAGNDTTVCEGATIQLHGKGGNTYYWYSSNSIPNQHIPNPIINVKKATAYYLVVSNTYGCNDTDNVMISVFPKPIFTLEPDSSDICIGEKLTLSANGGDTYIWWPDSAIISQNGNQATISPSQNINIFVAVHELTCNNRDTLVSKIRVNPVPLVTVSKTNDISCNKGFSVLQATGANEYLWYPVYGLDSIKSSSVTASPQHSTTYSVVGTSEFGCKDTSQITVDVTNSGAIKLMIPDAFSPNGDGINDCYRVKSNIQLNNYELAIYNRWGERVYYSHDINSCWDGIYKGQELQLGTYNYYLIIKTDICGEMFYKGTIQLIK